MHCGAPSRQNSLWTGDVAAGAEAARETRCSDAAAMAVLADWLMRHPWAAVYLRDSDKDVNTVVYEAETVLPIFLSFASISRLHSNGS